jgi:hypothetical protein
MGSHHDHPVTETKSVSFSTPLILALVTVLLILLGVSTCDGGHHGKCECKEDCSKECMEKCEKGDHSGHHEGKEAHGEHHEATAVVATEEVAPTKDSTSVAADTTHAAPAEAAHTEAHH